MSVTLAALRTAIRQRAKMENSTFVTDAEINTLINISGAELHGLLVTTYEDYSLTKTTATVAVGANTIALPSDLMKLRKLEYQMTSQTGDWTRVPRVSLSEIDKLNFERSRFGARVRGYLLDESTVFLLPEATADGTYRVWYARQYVTMSSDSDTISNANQWHEYIIVDVAMKCVGMEEGDVSLFAAQKLGLIDRINKEASNRDAGEPARVVDVRGDDDGFGTRWPRRGWGGI